jgi:histone-lysine N-methyltransferase SETMAR
MSPIRDFVAGLARAGKTFKEIQETTEAAYGENALKKTQIYEIIRAVKEGKATEDQRQNNGRRKVRSPDFVAEIAAKEDKDRRVTIRKLAAAHGVCMRTVQLTLHEDLDLSKKSARWVPKLLTNAHKEERIRTCEKFLAMLRGRSLAFLDLIVTMDESAVSFHTPESKMQSKQWTKKGQPGPIKAKVHATRNKQMVLAFFDNEGLIYTNYVPKGQTVNANYIVDALSKFLVIFKTKRPNKAAQQWFFHWDNAPVHTAAVVQDWMAARDFRLIDHPPYSPDLAPADFFLFPTIKRQLAGKTLTQGTFKTMWEGAARSIAKEAYATAFRRWYERCEKCVQIGGGYVEKS